MEVKKIEQWGADWRNVVVGELLAVEKHPRADRLSLTRVTIGDGEPLEIVCGATNIAVGQRVPVALPGAVLPGDRRIERTEKMGVVSNGMLCSGEELNLTSDGDGILILPDTTPIGAAADRGVRRRRARRRCQAEPWRRAVDRRSRTRGRGGDGRDGGAAADRARRVGPADRRTPAGGGRGSRAVPAVRRALGERRDRRPVAGPRPDAAAGRRSAAREQRRRREQLRHGRARQADPHLRCPCRARRPDHRAPRASRGAAPDPRPHRTRARSGDAPHRRPDRSDRDCRRDGRSRRPR